METEGDTWTQIDKPPTVFEFTGEPGVKKIPNQSAEVGEKKEQHIPVKTWEYPSDGSSVCSDWDSEDSDFDPEYDEEVYQYLLKGKAFPYLRLFITDELIDYIVAQTNQTAEMNLAKVNESRRRVKLVWKPITNQEMWTFLGLVYATGGISATQLLFGSQFVKFVDYMQHKRFSTILALLTLGNDNTPRSMKRVEPVFDMICSQFSSVYKPERELCLFEAVIPWVSDEIEMMVILKKAHKMSVKVYIVCESESGYVCRIMPCYKNHKSVDEVIAEMLKEYLQQGYHIYLNGCPLKLSLVRELYEHKTHICAEVKLPKDMPSMFKKARSEVKKNKPSFVRNGETLVMFCPRMGDSKATTFVSSMHDAKCVKHEVKWPKHYLDKRKKVVQAPKLQLDYQNFMYNLRFGVLIENYLPLKGDRLPVAKRLFLTLLQHAMINAYNLCKKEDEMKDIKYRHFLRAAVKDLLQEFADKEDAATSKKKNKKSFYYEEKEKLDDELFFDNGDECEEESSEEDSSEEDSSEED